MTHPTKTRETTNIALDLGLLAQARELEINIARACERGLAAQIDEVRAERWREKNGEALASSNAYVDCKGLPLARFRTF